MFITASTTPLADPSAPNSRPTWGQSKQMEMPQRLTVGATYYVTTVTAATACCAETTSGLLTVVSTVHITPRDITNSAISPVSSTYCQD